MAENADGQEKKHEPTEKRWRDAAEKGELPRSSDLSAGVVVLAGAVALLLGAGGMRGALEALWVDLFAAHGPPTLDRSEIGALGLRVGRAVVEALAVPLGVVSAAALVIHLAQSRVSLAPKALAPRWERLNVFSGFKQNYLSSQPAVELGKGLGKLVLLGTVVAVGLSGPIRQLPLVAAASPVDQMRVMGELVQRILTVSAGLVLLLGGADFAYRYWRQKQQLMLTDKEMRDEMKEREGDPQQKARRRQRARQIALGSMLAAVREADVVVTNPTHYAVALRYDRDAHVAPVVVAKGVDEVALKLRRAAREAGVPRIENRPLARGLYANVRVGHPIGEEYYGPVARVLAVVYAKRRRR